MAKGAVLSEALYRVAIKDDLENAGSRRVDREVVRDGGLVTSRTPDDLPAFMRTTPAALREA